MKRIFLLILALLSLIAIRPAPSFAQQACGTERWSVKTGTDADAASVKLSSTAEATIASLIALPEPRSLPTNNRLAPTETTVWVVTATLVKYKLETDSDYHLVIQDANGDTMIVEIPSPDCVDSSSPFKTQIAQVRAKFDGQFHASDRIQNTNILVRVTGVGFFDFKHGQTGVAPNAIELHPVLDIVFNPGPGSQPQTQPLPATQPATQPSTSAGVTWAYHVATAATAETLENQLTTLGAQGWELVSVVIDAQRPDKYVAYLKRQMNTD